MGALKYLLDSTVLIDALNQVPGSSAFLDQHASACAISPVTRAEVLVGFAEKEAALAAEWLSLLHYLPLDPAAADLAASLWRDQRWKLPDAFQAALALRHGLKLVTRNTKDFNPTKHSFVLVPYRV